ncbi:MAG: cytochrome c biogenesis protein ResB [Candidatus Nanopelagicales bacterium]
MSTSTPGAPEAGAAVQDSTEDLSAGLGTVPVNDLPPDSMKLGFVGWSRWMWRQLTSMRTALLLLFLLAVASIPGSVLPQRPVDPARVTQYLSDNPGVGGVFDRLGFFDVFTAPWYVAIYLLLVISLAGCIVPRTRLHWKAMRAQPPRAPSRLKRLPEYESWEVSSDGAGQQTLDDTAALLRKRRWRVRTQEFDGTSGWVSAEKGYLRETGNLLFHISLLGLLLGVAIGGMFGWRGQALVIEGESFSDTITQYDTFSAGNLVDSADLPPFSFTLNDFRSGFQAGGEQEGAARLFEADVTYRSQPGAEPEEKTVEVNDPLVVDGAKAYLVGHGYAPVIQVKNAQGQVIYDAPTVFLPIDGNFTSNGVVKMPDNDPQLALQGIFAPTAALDDQRGPHSTFPAADDPAVFFSAWKGNLGLDDGIPQSVYKLDTSELEQIGIKGLRPGESWTLPDGSGTVSFTGIKQYAVFDVAYDPGKLFALVASILAILGLMLSLFIPRRRVWVKVSAAADGTSSSTVEVAGLSRTDEAGLKPAVADLATDVRAIAPRATTPTPGDPTDPDGKAH